MTAVEITVAVLVGVPTLITGVLLLLRLELRLRTRREAPSEAPAVFVDADDPAALQTAVDALEALGFDVIPVNAPEPMSEAEAAELLSDLGDALAEGFDARRAREVHGMTPAELAEQDDMRKTFNAIVQTLSDEITLDQLTPTDRHLLSMFSTSEFGDGASLILPSGLSLTGADVRRLLAEMRAHPDQT